MKSAFLVAVVILTLLSLFTPHAFAAVADPGPPPPGTPSFFGVCGIEPTFYCLVNRLLQVLLAIVFFVAVLFMVFGGFRYIISGGNEEAVDQAKSTIVNSIIGMVVVLLSWIILRVIYTLLDQGATAAS